VIYEPISEGGDRVGKVRGSRGAMRLAGEKASQAKGIASAGADMGGRESGL